MNTLTGILIGIYITCLVLFVMIYLFLGSIRDELRETKWLLKRIDNDVLNLEKSIRRLHNESLQNLHEVDLEGKDA